jgi:hypothetical protein
MTVDIAWSEVIAPEPDAEGRYWTLGLATRDEPGYAPVKEDDPETFFKARFPTRFMHREEAVAQARKMNAELGLSDSEAFAIVASSMAAQRHIEGLTRRKWTAEQQLMHAIYGTV